MDSQRRFIYSLQKSSVLPFIDINGDIIVPKDVRPTINYGETQLGNRKGAKRQFRYKNLHIREYSGHYTVHVDKVDPRKDPLGHLLIDAPEFLMGIISAISVGRLVQFCYKSANERKRTIKNSI